MSLKTANPRARKIDAEKLADLKRNAEGILANDRREMLTRYPFFGQIAMGLNLIPVRDSRCSTAATDGENLFFDIEFLASLRKEDQIFVLAHEVLHNCMLHFLRTETRDRQLFNIATDMEVNSILRDDGLVPPQDALLPETYGFSKGHSAEEYYDMLLQLADKSNISQNDGDGESQNSGNANGCGNKDGECKGQFDKHIYKNDMRDDDEDNKNVEDRWGKVEHDPDFEPEVKENAVERMQEAVLTAAQTVERNRGELSDAIKNLVEKLLKPQVDWKEKLSSFVTKVSGDRACWAKPNKRYISQRMYLPSYEGDKVRVGVIIDTSGSTASDMNQFLSEVNAIVKGFGNYEMTIIQCDAKVQHVESYDVDKPLDLETQKFERYGNGGTRLKPAFDYVRDEQLDVDCLVCFTDAEIDVIESDACELPCLWVLTPGASQDAIKFGEIVEFKPYKA